LHCSFIGWQLPVLALQLRESRPNPLGTQVAACGAAFTADGPLFTIGGGTVGAGVVTVPVFFFFFSHVFCVSHCATVGAATIIRAAKAAKTKLIRRNIESLPVLEIPV
jgi:hypothetical protein